MPRLALFALPLGLALLLPLACVKPASGDDETGDDDDDTTGEPDEWDDLLEPLAGSRLRPMFRTAEDGTRIHVGWHDTLFDTPCAFGSTQAGELRCLPTTGGNDVWLYADADCTQPALQDIWIPEGATMLRARGDGCFDHSYYEIGEAVGELYYSANGPCQFFSNDPAHRVTLIPHEQFVAATLTPQTGQSRIVPLLLESDDGARQIFGAWDREHEEQVTPALDDGDQLRWFGRREPRMSTIYFADPECTQPVALAECVPDFEQPTTAKQTDAGYCGAFHGRHELLGEADLDQLYYADEDGCSPTSLVGYHIRAWHMGAPLDDGDFAESSTLDIGGDRLRHDIYTSPEGEPFLASGRVFDHQLDEVECRWLDPIEYSSDPSTSATFDCVPLDAPRFGSRYQDPSCTHPIAERFVFEESCPPGPALYAYDDGMAGAITGPSGGEGGYGLNDQDVCISLPPSEPPDGGGGEYEYFIVDDSMVPVAQAVDVIE